MGHNSNSYKSSNYSNTQGTEKNERKPEGESGRERNGLMNGLTWKNGQKENKEEKGKERGHCETYSNESKIITDNDDDSDDGNEYDLM